MTLHATYRPVRPQRPCHARKRATMRPRAGEKSCNQRLSFAAEKPQPRLHCSQQYSPVALTTSTAAIAERYAYSAYGAPTVCNASGTDIGTSAKDNRITYTGREWDDELVLYHFRARLYDASVGRFLGRDPIGFGDGFLVYNAYFVPKDTDPSGMLLDTLSRAMLGCARIREIAEKIKCYEALLLEYPTPASQARIRIVLDKLSRSQVDIPVPLPYPPDLIPIPRQEECVRPKPKPLPESEKLPIPHCVELCRLVVPPPMGLLLCGLLCDFSRGEFVRCTLKGSGVPAPGPNQPYRCTYDCNGQEKNITQRTGPDGRAKCDDFKDFWIP
jgi:RHS repeat-associated protein